ncbi:hypothetical protein [Candidatus Nitrosocosmicus sp. SS]|uniref:hypothetical protein n=1 Tax=Candidatus Nitrosocosmicus agrestis TaxID=2563600 RepID=UPI00122E337F|nr:hypothetical protein [Candidatus Nitrosocosmicus sp. SS]KAA2283377.1 hypothetical protein F1Z66_02470 [Candidatus Nitrosocosmicus sp. SS]KAF0868977.1 hypothetical protein E5N71_08260 [Candidatus Nitrosocosmicus sp. SS]
MEELRNNGLIDEFESKIDRRKKAYYPIVDVSLFQQTKYKNYTNTEENDNNLHFIKLNLPKKFKLIAEEWLKVEILELLKYGIGETKVFQLIDYEADDEDSKICICKFIKRYESNTKLGSLFQFTEEQEKNKIFSDMIPLSNDIIFPTTCSNPQTVLNT